MKNTLIGPESVRMEQVHPVHFLDSFLDIPGAAWNPCSALSVAPALEKALRTPGGAPGKISGLGIFSDRSDSDQLVRLGGVA